MRMERAADISSAALFAAFRYRGFFVKKTVFLCDVENGFFLLDFLGILCKIKIGVK